MLGGRVDLTLFAIGLPTLLTLLTLALACFARRWLVALLRGALLPSLLLLIVLLRVALARTLLLISHDSALCI